MASKIAGIEAPLPTSVGHVKQLAKSTGSVAMVGAVALAGIGVLMLARPYLERFPVIGSVFRAAPRAPAAAAATANWYGGMA